MRVHPARQYLDLIAQRGQGRAVAFGQLADAPGQRLADAIQFALHAGGQRVQPFVLHHQRLDVGCAQLRIVGRYLGVERFLGVFGLFAGAGLHNLSTS